MNAIGYRWEAEDGSGHWTSGVRLGFGWRPHSWLNLVADYDRTGGGEGGVSFHAGFRMPLGRLSYFSRWEGLGVAAGNHPCDVQCEHGHVIADTGMILSFRETNTNRIKPAISK